MKLPGRLKLAKEYGVGVATVERAIAPLVSEGLLSANDRSGTFVARRPAGDAEADAGEVHAGEVKDGGPELGAELAHSFGIIAAFSATGEDAAEIYQVWIGTIISSLERAFSRDGGTTNCFNLLRPGGGRLPVRDAIESLLADGADAIALIDFDVAELTQVLSSVRLGRTPLVCIVDGEIGLPVMQVFYDHRSSGFQAAQHLLRRGCDDLLFVAPFAADWLEQRILGARDAVRQAGLPDGTLRVYPGAGRRALAEEFPDFIEYGYRAAKAAFAADVVGSGVLAPNDFTAYGILKAASEAGKEAGIDFGLVGFDDTFDSRSLALTTLHPPLEAMGEEAGRLLVRALQGDRNHQHVRLRSHLIARASTRLLSSPSSTRPHGHLTQPKGELSNVHA